MVCVCSVLCVFQMLPLPIMTILFWIVLNKADDLQLLCGLNFFNFIGSTAKILTVIFPSYYSLFLFNLGKSVALFFIMSKGLHESVASNRIRIDFIKDIWFETKHKMICHQIIEAYKKESDCIIAFMIGTSIKFRHVQSDTKVISKYILCSWYFASLCALTVTIRSIDGQEPFSLL